MPQVHYKTDAANFGNYQGEIYQRGLEGQRPTMSVDSRDWEKQAKERLAADSYGYLAGSAGEFQTAENNRAAFRKWNIMPRMLQGNTYRDLSVELFGKKYPGPLLMAPIGVNKIFHPHGEEGVVHACAETGVPYIMSTASSTSIEDVAAASDGPKWFQLYWPMEKDNDITASMLHRAQDSGFEVLVVTLDLWALSWRPMDLNNAYVPFWQGIGDQIGFTDPVFKKKYQDANDGKWLEDDLKAVSIAWENVVFSGAAHKWEDLKFLKEHWKGPIVLKGIQTVEDAQEAVKFGMDGIIVDNHGGRQYDGAIGSLDVLPEIVDAVGQKLTVLFGSGIRTGADAMKALALGAKACLLGRPVIYGLSVDGEEGAKHVLKSVLADLDMNVGLTGYTNLSDLQRGILRRESGGIIHPAASH